MSHGGRLHTHTTYLYIHTHYTCTYTYTYAPGTKDVERVEPHPELPAGRLRLFVFFFLKGGGGVVGERRTMNVNGRPVMQWLQRYYQITRVDQWISITRPRTPPRRPRRRPPR